MKLLWKEEEKTKGKGREDVEIVRASIKEPLNLASSVHVTTIEENKVHVREVYTSMN
jgi:hypothetical protein